MPEAGFCSVCEHDDRGAIETALQAGIALRTIADQHGVSKSAIIRHKAHVQQSRPAASSVQTHWPYDPLLAKQARSLEEAITDALRNGHAVDLRWALQDIARLLVSLTKPTEP